MENIMTVNELSEIARKLPETDELIQPIKNCLKLVKNLEWGHFENSASIHRGVVQGILIGNPTDNSKREFISLYSGK